jgi:hypothetical protein
MARAFSTSRVFVPALAVVVLGGLLSPLIFAGENEAYHGIDSTVPGLSAPIAPGALAAPVVKGAIPPATAKSAKQGFMVGVDAPISGVSGAAVPAPVVQAPLAPAVPVSAPTAGLESGQLLEAIPSAPVNPLQPPAPLPNKVSPAGPQSKLPPKALPKALPKAQPLAQSRPEPRPEPPQAAPPPPQTSRMAASTKSGPQGYMSGVEPPSKDNGVNRGAPPARTASTSVALPPGAGRGDLPRPIPQIILKPIPPVAFKVSAIAGEWPNYVAVIEYNNETYVVQPGTSVPSADEPAIMVRGIGPTLVEAYDPTTRTIVRRALGPLASR